MLTIIFVVYPHGTSEKHLRSFTVRIHIQVNSKRNKTETILRMESGSNSHRASHSALMSSDMLDGGEEQDKAVCTRKKKTLEFPFQ